MSLQNNETPLLHRYWRKIGGTLVEEFRAVNRSKTHGERRIDGIIIKNEDFAIKKQSEVSIQGKDIIVVQVKTGRLGMYLMGQALFSKRLMERFRPRTIQSVALCETNDDILAPYFEEYGVRVVLDKATAL